MALELAESGVTAELDLRRHPARFESDDRRVITLPFTPGGEPRLRAVVRRVCRLSETEVDQLLESVYHNFQDRHADIDAVLLRNYKTAMQVIGEPRFVSHKRKLLIGSYFTMEYSIESAALFNPSIVPHFDQRNAPDGALRFIVSLRAVGEGHVSSIVFRTGTIHADHQVEVDQPKPFISRATLAVDKTYMKKLFWGKLADLHVSHDVVGKVMAHLGENFSFAELEHAIDAAQRENGALPHSHETYESMRWLARSNYEVTVGPDEDISGIAIFPQSEPESHGIEDLRLVHFTDDDGSVSYYGTYTAFSGFSYLPQLLETSDWRRLGMHTLNGKCVQNKGLALFPRRIDGHYVMCSRLDGENLYIMYSDMLHFWESAELMAKPKYAWEFMHIGNCGSPLETDAGWLLLTHGVGPMRQYAIGAMLLDLEDPRKVIGHLSEPLLTPAENERDGYVPNVVYSCGGIIHAGRLYIPYAMSDLAASFASVDLDALLARLTT